MNLHYEEIKKTVRTVTTVSFYKNLVKVFDKVVTDTNGHVEENTSVFITSEENVNNATGLNSISKRVFMPGLYNNYAVVSMISNDNFDLLLKGKVRVYDENVIEDYDDFKYNENDYKLVLWNWGSYELVDFEGKHIPVAVRVSYDYNCGRMTNKEYDLEKIVKLLKDNENIMAYQEERYKENYGKRRELSITKIPYYNSTDEEYNQLEFYFVPTVEVLNEAMKMGTYERIPYMLKEMFGIKRKMEDD